MNPLINVETRSGLPAGVPRQKIEFTYDSQGRRRTKKVSDWNGSAYTLTREHEFFWDNWNLIEERITEGAATSVNRFVWGLDLSGSLQGAGGVGGLVMMELDGVVYFPVFDGNGNVVALIDEQGSTAASYEYGPFGETLRMSGPAAAANPFRFSTKYFDGETGLYYYGYRYYSPEFGRWLNRDPLLEWGGMNLYSICQNRQLNEADSLGLQSLNQVDDDGRPAERCCEAAPPYNEELVLVFCMTAPPPSKRRADGWTCCFAGKKYAYVQPSEAFSLIPMSPNLSREDYRKCVVEHEAFHVQDDNCLCPVCPDKRAHEVVLASYRDEAAWKKGECAAHQVHVECLQQKLKLLSQDDAAARAVVQKWIEIVRDAARTRYGCDE